MDSESENDRSSILPPVTRRSAMGMAVAGGFAGASIGKVVASGGSSQFNIEEGETKYYQSSPEHHDDIIDRFEIEFEDITFEFDEKLQEDKTIGIEIGMRIRNNMHFNGDWTFMDYFANTTKKAKEDDEEITFYADEIVDGGSVDLSEIGIVGPQYDHITVSVEPNSMNDQAVVHNEIQFQIQLASMDGDIYHESDPEDNQFNFRHALPFGFGTYFGRNFGTFMPSDPDKDDPWVSDMSLEDWKEDSRSEFKSI